MGLFDRIFGRGTPTLEVSNTFRPPTAATPAFAVIDVETTGLSARCDRVLELAVVRTDAQGQVVDEWSSRFNPEGPVGATHIHGITQADVADAPLFRLVAPWIAGYLRGLPIAAHNAKFDLAFLRAEYALAGWDVPWLPSYCTLEGSRYYWPNLDRRRLIDCCWAAGVELENAHSALGDARATAGLLGRYLVGCIGGVPVHGALQTLPLEARAVAWPDGPVREPGLAPTRAPARFRPTPKRPARPPLIRQLSHLSLNEVLDEGASESVLAYLETLFDVLEDGDINAYESTQLVQLTETHGITEADVAATHRALMLALAHRAVDDGHVSQDERRELATFAELLGVAASEVTTIITQADAARTNRMSAGLEPLPDDWNLGEPLRVGDKVAFTGCDDEQRARLEQQAEKLGVRVMGSVSRQTAMLITDGSYVGGKHERATALGIRKVHPDVFEILLAHLQPAENAMVSTLKTRAKAPNPGHGGVAAKASSQPAVPSSSEIRTWAIEHGFQVGVRGRIPREALEAYAAALAGEVAGERS